MSNHIYPALRYRDAAVAVEFLERAFGFERVQIHEDDGLIGHAEMSWGESMIMFGSETPEGIRRWGSHAGQAWLYVTVDDADAHCERARQAGAEIIAEPFDTDYGSRDYAARDPEGNLWNFGTYDPLAGG
jgi:uncharacterized glyoxalase superfamily protein PhnB